MKYFFDNFDERYLSLKAMRKSIPELAKIYGRMDSKMRAAFVKSDEFKTFFEHKSECGGCKDSCCAKGPCGHSANDFDFFEEYSFEKLRERIDAGKTSINVHVGKGIWTDAPEPAFTLSARADKGSLVNFQLPQGKCSMLTPDGCAYTFDERPTIAILFANTKKRGCRNMMDMRYDSNQWMLTQRQDVLQRLVKHFYDSNEPFKKNFLKTVDKERDMSLGIF